MRIGTLFIKIEDSCQMGCCPARVRKDEWESAIDEGYSGRAACLHRVKLGRKLYVRAESAFPTATDIVDYGRAFGDEFTP